MIQDLISLLTLPVMSLVIAAALYACCNVMFGLVVGGPDVVFSVLYKLFCCHFCGGSVVVVKVVLYTLHEADADCVKQ